jgi:hypothetical protein
MPANVVKTKADEAKWKRAQLIAEDRLGKGRMKNVKKGSERYWKLVMFLFKRLKGQKE